MECPISLKGNIITDPVIATEYTWFKLQCNKKECNIIRLDREWWKRDMVFLCIGQTVEVMGKRNTNDNSIIADRILIRDYPSERLLQRKD